MIPLWTWDRPKANNHFCFLRLFQWGIFEDLLELHLSDYFSGFRTSFLSSYIKPNLIRWWVHFKLFKNIKISAENSLLLNDTPGIQLIMEKSNTNSQTIIIRDVLIRLCIFGIVRFSRLYLVRKRVFFYLWLVFPQSESLFDP